MNRKQYIQSLGATCNNWQNSWSFIHREKKFVIFGHWQNRHTGEIFSEDWKSKKTGRRTPGYKQSKEHIRLVWEEGYDLFVFPMYAKDPEAETPSISRIDEILLKRTLEPDEDHRNWYARDSSPPVIKGSSSWIFQGNPKVFDIDDYLTRYPQLIYWRTPTHKKSIALGDRAFMWRAGENAGIIASGKVVELPTLESKIEHPEALGGDLWTAHKLATKKVDPKSFLVGISLDSVRLTVEEGMIPRVVFKDDPLLAGNTIMRQANATVFAVTPSETARIEELWRSKSSNSSESFDGSVIEGNTKVYSHRKRERSRWLVRKKIEQARKLGAIQCEICFISEKGAYPEEFASRIFEVHHLMPLALVESPKKTTLEDLAVVCANCHRAVHATDQVEENFRSLKKTFSP